MSVSLDTAGSIVFKSSGTGANSYSASLVAPTAMTADRSITIPDAGANSSLLLAHGAQTVNGAMTLAAGASAPANSGFKLTGIVENAAHDVAGGTLGGLNGANRTLNSKSGRLRYFGIASVVAGGTDSLSILSNVAGSSGLVSLEVEGAANGSNIQITEAQWTANTGIVIGIKNRGATDSAANTTLNFSFISFN